MDIIHVIIFAIVQGVTELFPVSSLGHAILLAHIFGWGSDLKSPTLLPFLTALHLGTAIALLIYFWKDWIAFLKPSENHPVFGKKNSTVLGYIVMATIPVGLVALILEKKLGEIFSQPLWVATFLILNGILLLVGNFLKKRLDHKQLATLTPKTAVMIGSTQILALLPGFSRSGSTLVTGMLLGFDEEAAAHFSFLLATPLIFAANLYELPKLLKLDLHAVLLPTIIGGVVAGICAYISTAFLMKYFKHKEVSALAPFGIYCIVVGVISLFIR